VKIKDVLELCSSFYAAGQEDGAAAAAADALSAARDAVFKNKSTPAGVDQAELDDEKHDTANEL
jgi:hypothetical protein